MMATPQSGSGFLVFSLFCLCSVSSRVVSAKDNDRSVILKSNGDSFTISCTTNLSKWVTVRLYTRHKVKKKLLHYDKDSSKISGNNQKYMVQDGGKQMKFNVLNLTEEDTGVYWCVYSYFDGEIRENDGDGAVLLIINGHVLCEPIRDKSVPKTEEEKKRDNDGIPFYLVVLSCMTAVTVVLLSAIWICKWLKPKVKTLCIHRTEDPQVGSDQVYEIMHNHRRGP